MPEISRLECASPPPRSAPARLACPARLFAHRPGHGRAALTGTSVAMRARCEAGDVHRAWHDGEARRVGAQTLHVTSSAKDLWQPISTAPGMVQNPHHRQRGGFHSRIRPSGRRPPGWRRRWAHRFRVTPPARPSRRDNHIGRAEYRTGWRACSARIAAFILATSVSKSPPFCSPTCSRPITLYARHGGRAGHRHRRGCPRRRRGTG